VGNFSDVVLGMARTFVALPLATISPHVCVVIDMALRWRQRCLLLLLLLLEKAIVVGIIAWVKV
jgi:hypothetical protein